jgi:hypothetical protein
MISLLLFVLFSTESYAGEISFDSLRGQSIFQSECRIEFVDKYGGRFTEKKILFAESEKEAIKLVLNQIGATAFNGKDVYGNSSGFLSSSSKIERINCSIKY